ncbi:ninein-like protein isoform X3 [Dreissena polymorpha]|nr:ninein-like protein isoform X3 [Dreissena polymorpha]
MSDSRLSESAEHDMYLAQLKEVFDSCDQTGSGSLSRTELFLLCEKLQLEEQSEFFVNELLKDTEEVSFEDFQTSFVNILCQTYATKATSSDEEEDEDEEDEEKRDEEALSESNAEGESDVDCEQTEHEDPGLGVKREKSPLYKLGEKHYGRLSMPATVSDGDEDMTTLDEEDIEVASSTMSLKHSLVVDEASDTDEDSHESQKKRQRRDPQDAAETFEAEGQLNVMMAEQGSLTEEENYLRDIWTNLGVGKHGYIDIDELARVCNHIGMEEMDTVQLQQLFDKLDADGDGRVSFKEFQEELFQHNTPSSNHTPPTNTSQLPPRSKGTTPTRSTSAQKKLKFPGSEERLTPSSVLGTGKTGLFSEIDPERTGFAKPEDITDWWEKNNVSSPADVLVELGFDLENKVNLSELTAALEQELLNVEDQSAVYQAATASYQQEMRHLKSSLEQAVWAKEKLKLDLSEANARNALLAKEVDERHANMEKSTQEQLLSIEQKYSDQVKALQSDLDRERESMAQLSVRYKQGLEREMADLKHEEARLRDQLSQAQKEIERQGHDLDEVTGQLEESERQCQRLQREVEGVQELHMKLADYESKAVISPEEQQFTREKLQRLELENKDLKDHNDELTAELETLKLQSPGSAGGRGEGGADTTGTPIRKDGSLMSHYIKPTVVKNTSFSSTEFSDDEGRASRSPGRRLPAAPFEEDDIRKRLFKSSYRHKVPEGIGTPSDKELIVQLQQEVEESRHHLEIERRDIEQACRLEITNIEARHDQEKAELYQLIENEKERIAHEFDRLQQEALSELARELQTTFAHEKEELVQKHTTEKNHLQQKHKEDFENLKRKFKSEQKEALEKQKNELRAEFDQDKLQLEEALAESGPFIKGLEEKIKQLEQKQVKQQENSERELKRQKTEMEGMLTRHLQRVEDVERQKHALEGRWRKQVSDTEVQHRSEVLELRGEIDQLKLAVREADQGRAGLELELKQQRAELELSWQQERHEVGDVYEGRIQDLEAQCAQAEKQLQALMAGDVDRLPDTLQARLTSLVERDVTEALSKEKTRIQKEVETRLNTEFETRNSELSHVLEREKEELQEHYEAEIGALRGELERLKGSLVVEREALQRGHQQQVETLEGQLAQQIREELESEFADQLEELRVVWDEEKAGFQSQTDLLQREIGELQDELESANQSKRRLDEAKKANSRLQKEKRQSEKSQHELRATMEETCAALEGRIAELKAEKEGAVTAVRAQFMESSKQSGRDKAGYDALVMEKETLEKKVASLSQELSQNQSAPATDRELQKQLELLHQENQELRSRVSDGSKNNNLVPEHAQRAINELTREKSEVEEKLFDLETRYHEVEDMAKKYTHLQKKYEDVSRERDKVSHLAKTLKEQLNQSTSAQREEHQDKGQLASVLEEKKQLESQLQKISDKLLEATTNFSISQSQHIRELQQWKEQCSNMVDLQKFTRLQIDLVDNQRSLRDLQELLKNKEENSTSVFKEESEKHSSAVKSLETQKDSLQRKLSTLQQILDSQIDRFKQQYEASEKRNALVVDLYKENADLMDSLYRIEEQKKDAVSRCYRLEDQCNHLKKMLKRLAIVAVT